MKIKKKVLAVLHEVWREGCLTKVKRERFDEVAKYGFVLDISEEWLLLHSVDANYLQSDGYEAIRLCDITEVEKDVSWIAQALTKLGLQPVLQPDVLLLDLPGLLSSVNAHYPVLGIEREKTVPGVLDIGRIEKIRKKSVTLRELGWQATWYSSEARYLFSEITSVSFGTAYMNLLLEFARAQEAEAATDSSDGI